MALNYVKTYLNAVYAITKSANADEVVETTKEMATVISRTTHNFLNHMFINRVVPIFRRETGIFGAIEVPIISTDTFCVESSNLDIPAIFASWLGTYMIKMGWGFDLIGDNQITNIKPTPTHLTLVKNI